MRPSKAGACRNTAALALDHAKAQLTLSKRLKMPTQPWRQAIADAKVALKEAERFLVRC